MNPPYLSLVPFKNFGQVNEALGGLKEEDTVAAKKNAKSKVQWNHLLDQDLETLLKEKLA